MPSFPVTFKEFSKDPVKAVLFLALMAIMYLYIDNKMTYKNQIKDLTSQVQKLENKVDTLQNKLIDAIKESSRAEQEAYERVNRKIDNHVKESQ
jgi:outer membrane murein-binding lipoprotein Lpp